jgi:hypothetical protein
LLEGIASWLLRIFFERGEDDVFGEELGQYFRAQRMDEISWIKTAKRK